MKNAKKILLVQIAVTAIASTAMLTACGGGGGRGTSTPATVETPTAPVIASQLQLTVAAPPYAAGSEDLKTFNLLNDLRRNLGLGVLAYSAELDKASANHGKYLVLNNLAGHTEDPKNTGFTGINPIDQVRFAGYVTTSNSIGGAISHGYGKTDAFLRNVDSIYHRSQVFGQEWTEVGSAEFCYAGFCGQLSSINLYLGHKDLIGQTNAPDFVMFYPQDKQTNVGVSFGNESPNPFPIEHPSGEFAGKVGYPISFVVANSQTLSVKSFTVTEAGQTIPLSAWLQTKDTDPNKFILKNEAYLTAKASLKPSTTYNVKVDANVGGKEVSRSWSFTTSPAKT